MGAFFTSSSRPFHKVGPQWEAQCMAICGFCSFAHLQIGTCGRPCLGEQSYHWESTGWRQSCRYEDPKQTALQLFFPQYISKKNNIVYLFRKHYPVLQIHLTVTVIFRSSFHASIFWDHLSSNSGEGLLSYGAKTLIFSPQGHPGVPFCCHFPSMGEDFYVLFSIPSAIPPSDKWFNCWFYVFISILVLFLMMWMFLEGLF